MTTSPDGGKPDAASRVSVARRRSRAPGGPSGRLLRPRQDDHREVERAGLQPAVLRRRPDQPAARAAQHLRAVRLPHRRRRPRPDGEDAGVPLHDGHRLAGRHGARDRRRHPAQHRRPAGVRRGGLADRGAPPRRSRRHHRLGLRDARWSSRSASCSASTPSSRASCRSRTAATPARSTSTPTPRTRRPRSSELAERRGYDLSRSYAYSDSITDVHMLEIVGHPHAVNPDKELRRVARERGWPVLVFDRPVALAARMRLPGAAQHAGRAGRGYGGGGRRRDLPRRPQTPGPAHVKGHLDRCGRGRATLAGRQAFGRTKETTTQDPHTSQAPTR